MASAKDDLATPPPDALQLVKSVESHDRPVEEGTAAVEHTNREHEQNPSTSLSPANADDSTPRTSTAADCGPRPISKDYSNATPPPTPPKLSINGKVFEDEQEEEHGEGAVLGEDVPRPLSTANEEEEEACEDVTLSSRTPAEVGEDSSASEQQQGDAPPPPPSHSPTLPSPATPPPPSQSPALSTLPSDSASPAQSTTNASSTPSRPLSITSTTSRTTAPSSSAPAAGRRSSVASTTTISASGTSSLVSGILIISALESIAASKEAKKSKPLKDAVDAALDALKHPVPSPSTSTAANANGTVDPLVIFTPLRLACETKSLPLMISALDCISKLVSYDFFHDEIGRAHV